MRFKWILASAVTCCLVFASAAIAQVVRGTVRRSDTQAPTAGVLITLRAISVPHADVVRTVVTDGSGAYAVRAPSSGRYTIEAKRVGFRLQVLQAFDIREGETRATDIVLEPIGRVQTLDPVRVRSITPCAAKGADRDRVAFLWQEASAALASAVVAQRDSQLNARILRYTRELDPSMTLVRAERSVVKEGSLGSPFRSVDIQLLHERGFVQPEGDSLRFFAPDAETFLSNTFLSDHCFALVEGSAARPSQVGLGFTPRPDRRIPEISGRFWLDSLTRELISVEFAFVNLPTAFQQEGARGSVAFTLSALGTWLPSRWFVRMPLLGAPRAQGFSARLLGYLEEGGHVRGRDLREAGPFAMVRGVLRDQEGTVRSGATVRLSGTLHTSVTGEDGSYQIDSIATGNYSVVVSDPWYDSLGVRVEQASITTSAGSQHLVNFTALSPSAVIQLLCRRRLVVGHAALQVATEALTGSPRSGMRVRVSYNNDATGTVAPATDVAAHEGITGGDGRVAFCNVPALKLLRIEVIDRRRRVVSSRYAVVDQESLRPIVIRW